MLDDSRPSRTDASQGDQVTSDSCCPVGAALIAGREAFVKNRLALQAAVLYAGLSSSEFRNRSEPRHGHQRQSRYDACHAPASTPKEWNDARHPQTQRFRAPLPREFPYKASTVLAAGPAAAFLEDCLDVSRFPTGHRAHICECSTPTARPRAPAGERLLVARAADFGSQRVLSHEV